MLTTRVRKAAKALLKDDSANPWPQPDVKIEFEPHFLFIITPPHSGSTALAHILNTAQGAALLNEQAEGQWLVPGMCAADRWEPSKVMNWDSIRAMWYSRINMLRTMVNADLIIEKSPPNILRIDQLIKAFPNSALMAFNRDPFANTGSILSRHHDPQSKTEAERIAIVKILTKGWVDRAVWVQKWITELKAPYFSYEEFCERPMECIARLTDATPGLKTVDAQRGIRVKDYKRQTLENQNARQVSYLTHREIETISEQLNAHRKLVSFFGYDADAPLVEWK